MKNYNERKRLTDRKVNKRVKIVTGWAEGTDLLDPMLKTPGKFRKNNLACGCRNCKPYKYVGNSKDRFKHSDLMKMVT